MIKFYNPLGKVCMTSDYFAGLVGAAAQSCYGVCGMATGGTSDSLKTIVLGTNYPDKGVRVTEEDGKLVWECPKCGNRDQNKLNVARRTCGYIGTQFWNQGRTQEIKERVLHL